MSKKIKTVLTEKQQLAMFYLLADDTRTAILTLQGDKNSGNEIPAHLWKAIGHKAAALGDCGNLDTAYEYLGEKIPLSKWLHCAKAAMIKQTAQMALEAYIRAGVKCLPQKKLLTKAEQEFVKKTSTVAEYLEICAYFKIEPKASLLASRLIIAKAKHSFSEVVLICKTTKKDVPVPFINDAYQHFCAHFDLVGMKQAAGLMNKKIKDAELRFLAKKAFKAKKTEEGEKFVKEIFQRKVVSDS